MKKKKKFYVVWQGKKTGIFNSWNDCKQQVDGFYGAKYMGFYTKAEAELAFSKNYESFIGKKGQKKELTTEDIQKYGKPIGQSIAVDAAFSGKTKMMEYQGVFVETSTNLFHLGPIKGGSNNIGEFLALVHVLAYQEQHKLSYPIYSDSKIAISWIHQKICKTKVDRTKENPKILNLIARAEMWLRSHDIKKYKILKWHTAVWGEIPADFGRK